MRRARFSTRWSLRCGFAPTRRWPTGPGPLEVAETALALLHLYKPTTVNEVLVAAPEALRRVIEPNVVTYEVRVRTQACAAYAVPQVDAPRGVECGASFAADGDAELRDGRGGDLLYAGWVGAGAARADGFSI